MKRFPEGVDPRSRRGAATTSFHPELVAKLEELGKVTDLPAGGRGFVEWVDGLCREVEDLRGARGEVTRERSSFENLFRISPIPIMQQDYSRLERWMEQRKWEGTSSLEDCVSADIESIRQIVPLITMVAANPAAERAVGLAPGEMLGPIDPRIVNPGSERSWLTQMGAVWDRKPVAHATFTAATAAGDSYDAESILAAPLIDGEPDFSRAVFTIIDVTPHRNEERRMQELMETKDRFLASVSHEIRTPLTAILGFARLLEGGEVEAEERRTMLAAVADHAQEMSDLVEDLLVAARVELGEVHVADVSVDAGEQAGQLLRAGGSFTEGVGIDVEGGELEVSADPSRLRQILRNLLTNAERYGGSEVSIGVRRAGSMVEIEVIDDGPGLPAEEWELVFEPYHRAHENPGQPDSVGIGLAISRQLAGLMGGRLDYRYRHGRSVFRLSLPAMRSSDR